MTDAPERIRLHKEKGKPWTSAQWDDDFYNPLEDVEIFIRADIADQRIREAEALAETLRNQRNEAEDKLRAFPNAICEAVAEAYRRAAAACLGNTIQGAYKAILALTPEEPK